MQTIIAIEAVLSVLWFAWAFIPLVRHRDN